IFVRSALVAVTFNFDSRRRISLQPICIRFERFACLAFQIVTIETKVNILERTRDGWLPLLQLIQTRLPSGGFASGTALPFAGTLLGGLGRSRRRARLRFSRGRSKGRHCRNDSRNTA